MPRPLYTRPLTFVDVPCACKVVGELVFHLWLDCGGICYLFPNSKAYRRHIYVDQTPLFIYLYSFPYSPVIFVFSISSLSSTSAMHLCLYLYSDTTHTYEIVHLTTVDPFLLVDLLFMPFHCRDLKTIIYLKHTV